MQTLKTTVLFLTVLFIAAACNEDTGGDASGCNSDSDCPDTQVCDMSSGQCVDESTTDGDSPEVDLESDGDSDTVLDGDSDSENAEECRSECPIINVKPGEVNFGAVYWGETSMRSFTITNDSCAYMPLIISAINYNELEYTSEFIIDPEGSLPEFPFSLEPGETMEVSIEYTPNGSYCIVEGMLEILTNACGAPVAQVELKAGCKCCTKYISVTPEEYDFGNVNLGDTPIEQEFTICNEGYPDGAAVLRVDNITTASGEWGDFKCISPNCVTPQVQPLRILPGEQFCETFVIQYNPQSLAGPWDPHMETIMIFNDSDTIAERIFKVDVMGSAESSSLFIHPYPIDFGSVTIGNSRERIVTLHNYSDHDITINLISFVELEGDNCDMFSFGEDLNAVQGSIILANNVQPKEFTVIYTPTDEGEHSCHIDVSSALEGAPHMQFPMLGRGKAENQPPICMVSVVSHGQPINENLEDVPTGTMLLFYGDISYDPDACEPTHPIIHYNWTVLEWPQESEETLHPFGMEEMNVYITFDVPGTYKFQLDVVDAEGLSCEEPFVIEVNVVEK